MTATSDEFLFSIRGGERRPPDPFFHASFPPAVVVSPAPSIHPEVEEDTRMTPLSGDLFFLFLTVGIFLCVRGIMFYGSSDSAPPEKKKAQIVKGIVTLGVGLTLVFSNALGFVNYLRDHM
jgi:hypothetical protein